MITTVLMFVGLIGIVIMAFTLSKTIVETGCQSRFRKADDEQKSR